MAPWLTRLACGLALFLSRDRLQAAHILGPVDTAVMGYTRTFNPLPFILDGRIVRCADTPLRCPAARNVTGSCASPPPPRWGWEDCAGGCDMQQRSAAPRQIDYGSLSVPRE